ncbi:putative 30S ribosomal subunit protein S1 [Candidatus Zinderia insecticola CARI]|uniref:Putative 30S ribosomal subunit protein S1 n=1 Tax=Zinderia insecticola (strain CARI) TaxID=871271 RepID=E0TIN6_ZINIC|nr:putative 30S ribosomal subunit protein S1 [Candidatus Zinderia insecticola CARI]
MKNPIYYLNKCLLSFNKIDKLLNEKINISKLKYGDILLGKIVKIDKKFVFIDSGLKSESLVPIEEFKNFENTLKVKLGDKVFLYLEVIEKNIGNIKLSYKKAQIILSWLNIENSLKKNKFISGYINGKIKGGLNVWINGIKAFLPGSLISNRLLKNINYINKKKSFFKIIKIDYIKKNVILSRKVILEEHINKIFIRLLSKKLLTNIYLKGIITSISNFGCFINIGGIEGLVTVNRYMIRRRIYLRRIFKLGQMVNVKIFRLNKKNGLLFLKIRYIIDIWKNISYRYYLGRIIKGKVINTKKYGVFINIKNNLKGLSHISEINLKKNINLNKIFKKNFLINFIIIYVNEKERKIGLSFKRCFPDFLYTLFLYYNKKNIIKTIINFKNKYGFFLKLPGNINGFFHFKNFFWIKKKYKFKNISIINFFILNFKFKKKYIFLYIKHFKINPFIKILK